MARPRKRPSYDAEKIMKKLMSAVKESYEETGELKLTAEEFDMSPLKIRKLLITAGAYESEIADDVKDLFARGKSIAEIQRLTGLGSMYIAGGSRR